jgi:lipopolysaccharide transport system ATP-binding protein
MSDTVIHVEGLGKEYRLGVQGSSYPTLREAIVGVATAPIRRLKALRHGVEQEGDATSHFWALRDVNFEVPRGQVIGIIGRNGAGKSTLLKILSRITEPSCGKAVLRGRVASLLEVGTGFHPELTGRENIYLNGSILGMRRVEIDRKFDQIVAFSEVEKFLDTPVKRYSSGMYVRLAFAVAAHLEPEILIVDEVLAVGDAEFQKKCLGKMQEVSTGQGRTVLFVSHNIWAVRSLCQQVLYLKQGQMAALGQTEGVVDKYLKDATHQNGVSMMRTFEPGSAGNDNVRMRKVQLTPRAGDGTMIRVDTPVDLEVEYENLKGGTPLVLNLAVHTLDGTLVFVSQTTSDKSWHGRPFEQGVYRSTCRIPANLLNDGTYRIRVLFLDEAVKHLYNLDDALFFTVHDIAHREGSWYGKWLGVVRPQLQWTTQQVSASQSPG